METEWKDSDKQSGFSGMGFVIQEVMVHTEPTPVSRGETHYNMAGASWNVRDLLEVSYFFKIFIKLIKLFETSMDRLIA